MIQRDERLRAREAELVSIIEAARALSLSNEWSTLKTYVFDGMVERLERQLKEQASNDVVDTSELYRLQGQIRWAKRFADLQVLSNEFRTELTSVRAQLTQS